MSAFDKISLALSLLGLGSNVVLALLPAEWRETHKTAVTIGHLGGLVLIGVGLYLLVISPIPAAWSASMLPKVSMVIGAVLLIGGAIWQIAAPGKAQTPLSRDRNPVTGAAIDSSERGPAATITATGAPGESAPTIGADVNATGCAGQSVTGLSVTQTGPGTGLSVTAIGKGDGPVIGLRATATTTDKPCN